MDIPDGFIEDLKLLKSKQVSASELAEKYGCARQTIYNWEKRIAKGLETKPRLDKHSLQSLKYVQMVCTRSRTNVVYNDELWLYFNTNDYSVRTVMSEVHEKGWICCGKIEEPLNIQMVYDLVHKALENNK